MKFLAQRPSFNCVSKFIYGAETPLPPDIAALRPEEAADRLTAAVEVNDEMKSLLAQALINKMGNAYGEIDSFALASISAQILRARGEDVTPRAGMALSARLKEILAAHKAGTLVAPATQPVVEPAAEVKPPTVADTGLQTPAEGIEGLMPPKPEALSLSSERLDTATLSHLERVFKASQRDRSNASMQNGELLLISNTLVEIEATLDMALEEMPAEQQAAFIQATGVFIRNELTNAKLDPGGSGINTVSFRSWQTLFENQLGTFMENPESIQAYLAEHSSMPATIKNPEVSFESVYSASTINVLQTALPAADFEALKVTALNRELSEEHLLGLATLIGQINSAHERISQGISTYANKGLGSANAETLALRRLESLQSGLLSGAMLDEAQTFLASPDFDHLLRRIDDSGTVVEALTQKAELSEALEEQRNNLTTFLDSVESGGGMFFTSRDLMPHITATRQALQEGDVAKAKELIEPIVRTVVGGLANSSASLRDVFFDTLYMRSAATATDTEGQTRIITAEMVATNPEALIQAIRAADDYDGATRTAAETALTGSLEEGETSEAMQTHITSYIETHKAVGLSAAKISLQASLTQLSEANPVQYAVLQNLIATKGEEAVLEGIATSTLAIQGFRNYATQNPGANNLTEIFDDMTGGGDHWTSYFDFNLSDASGDMVSSIIVETIVTGGIAGLARSIAKRIPAVASKLNVFTQAPAVVQKVQTAGTVLREAGDDVARAGIKVLDDLDAAAKGTLNELHNARGMTSLRAQEAFVARRASLARTLDVPEGVIDDLLRQLDDVAPTVLRNVDEVKPSAAVVRHGDDADNVIRLPRTETHPSTLRPVAPRVTVQMPGQPPTILGHAPGLIDNIAPMRLPRIVANDVSDLRVALRSGSGDVRQAIRVHPPRGMQPEMAARFANEITDDAANLLALAARNSLDDFTRQLDNVARQMTQAADDLALRATGTHGVRIPNMSRPIVPQAPARLTPARPGNVPVIQPAAPRTNVVPIRRTPANTAVVPHNPRLALTPELLNPALANVNGVPRQTLRAMAANLAKATKEGLDDFLTAVRALSRNQQLVMAGALATPVLMESDIVQEAIAGLNTMTATDPNRVAPAPLPTPDIERLVNSGIKLDVATVIAATTNPEEKLSILTANLTPEVIRSKKGEIARIMADYPTRESAYGKWHEINVRIAALFGITGLETGEAAYADSSASRAFGLKMQAIALADIKDLDVNLSSKQRAMLEDGKFGHNSIELTKLSYAEVSPSMITQPDFNEQMQNLAKTSNHKGITDHLAQLSGIGAIPNGNLGKAIRKKLGKQIQELAGITPADGILGRGSRSVLKNFDWTTLASA